MKDVSFFSHLLLLLVKQRTLEAQHLGDVQVVLAKRVETVGQVVQQMHDKDPEQLQDADDSLQNVLCTRSAFCLSENRQNSLDIDMMCRLAKDLLTFLVFSLLVHRDFI